jgi:hypothetical protein
MDDFAFQIATGEKFPRFIFSFEALDPTVLTHHLPLPECDKCAIGRAVYPVTQTFNLAGHDGSSEPAGTLAGVLLRTMLFV